MESGRRGFGELAAMYSGSVFQGATGTFRYPGACSRSHVGGALDVRMAALSVHAPSRDPDVPEEKL
jgi:hypothetical protein